jgi:DNA polymerase-3 subunit epsilon
LETAGSSENTEIKRILKDRPALKIIACNDEELSAHQQRLEAIEKAGGSCLWNQ